MYLYKAKICYGWCEDLQPNTKHIKNVVSFQTFIYDIDYLFVCFYIKRQPLSLIKTIRTSVVASWVIGDHSE